MWYAILDAASCGLEIDNEHATKLVEIGERIKRAVQTQIVPIHPENPKIRGVTNFVWTSPPTHDTENNVKVATNSVVVSPGRFDRSPCGTGTCARMAVMHARGELEVDEAFHHLSIIGSRFSCSITGTTKVGEYAAILPSVKGRAWITGTKQVMLDPDDPFPEGFQCGDQWHVST